jgi:hypothetical protein
MEKFSLRQSLSKCFRNNGGMKENKENLNPLKMPASARLNIRSALALLPAVNKVTIKCRICICCGEPMVWAGE